MEAQQQLQHLPRYLKLLAKIINLSESNVTVLLDHVSRGAAHPSVGFEDAARTRAQLYKALAGRAVELEVLESALWSCNLLDEVGSFSHPDGLTFDQFVVDVAPKDMLFHKFFNVLLHKNVVG